VIQNSLDRLLEGIAAALRADVAPALADPYARSQAVASAELVENLAQRVEWRCVDLTAVVERVRPLLEDACELAPAGELEAARRLVSESPPGGADNAALLRARDEHLAALAEMQAWLAGEAGDDADALRERVRAAVGMQLGEELERLRAARRLAKAAAR
jgi:hypothetical protein